MGGTTLVVVLAFLVPTGPFSTSLWAVVAACLVAVVLQFQRALDELQRARDHIARGAERASALANISRRLAAAPAPLTVLEAILQDARSALRVSVMVALPHDGEPIQACRTSVLTPHLPQVSDVTMLRGTEAPTGFRWALGVPIWRPCGHCSLWALARAPRHTDEADTNFLQSVAGLLATALETESGAQQARHAEKMAMVAGLAVDVAHDLGNYLTVFRCSAELLRRTSDSPSLELLADIEHAADRASLLAVQLETLGRHDGPTTVDYGMFLKRLGAVLDPLVPTRVAVHLPDVQVDVVIRPEGLADFLFELSGAVRLAGTTQLTVAGEVDEADGLAWLTLDGLDVRNLAPLLGATGHDQGLAFQQVPKPKAPVAPPDGVGGRLLLVEPDELARRSVRSVLEAYGYEVVAVRDAGEAVALLAASDDTAAIIAPIDAFEHEVFWAVTLSDGIPVVWTGVTSPAQMTGVNKPVQPAALARAVAAAIRRPT